MACLGENLAFRILHNNAPGVSLYLDGTIVGSILDAFGRLCTLPHGTSTFLLEAITEHHIVLIRALRFDRSCQHADTSCSR